MKGEIATFTGMILGTIVAAIGGWDQSIQILVFFMAVDYITGLMLAGIWHKSKKSESGALKSRAALKGLLIKFMMIVLVSVAHALDVMLDIHYIRDALAIALITNEGLSILENTALMGVPGTQLLQNALDVLQQKGEELGGANDTGKMD